VDDLGQPRRGERGERSEDQRGAGQRGGTQGDRDAPAEATTGHQDQALGQFRELVGELHRYPPAEGMSGDGGPVQAKCDQEVTQPGRVGAQRVVAGGGFRGLAVTEQVRGDDVGVAA
jgi:hypothetical protein